MRRRALVPLAIAAAPLGGVAALSAVAVATDAPATAPAAANDSLACVAPGDAAGIDAILTAAGSPMAGTGAVIVDAATEAGLDPRLVVAIAAHETMLETYGPAQAINNPFGLGPGMTFPDEAAAIRFATRTLARWYLPEGRDTIGEIGAKWAPVGVANDPGGLNLHWAGGVSRYYAALGGDPTRRPLLTDQSATPSCTGGAAAPAAAAGVTGPAPAAGQGPPVVVVWGGNAPRVTGTAPSDGAAPDGGGPAVMRPFAFPLAARDGGEVRYAGAACGAGEPCAVTLTAAVMTDVVEGRLVAGTAAERAAGIGFWIVRADGDRLGYGPLAAYAPGVTHGAEVALGQPLGQTTGSLAFAWTRDGTPVNPAPLLAATRPPDAPSTTS
jgi:hypothetical protein